jgi:hypothetical protein
MRQQIVISGRGKKSLFYISAQNIFEPDQPQCLNGKFHPITCHKGTREQQRYSDTFSLTSALDRGWWLTSCPGRHIRGNNSIPVLQKAG